MNNYSRTEQAAITRALNIVKSKWQVAEGEPLCSPTRGRDYMRLYLADEMEREHFAVIFLNAQHEPLATETLFMGTIDGAAVYPREVARRALELNSSALILGHNHPSGKPNPSNADKRITERLVEAMRLLDIRILDHIIVAGNDYYSFAEGGDL